MHRSISPIINIHPKNAAISHQFPAISPSSLVRESRALESISTKDTYSMTPAENHNAAQRNFGLRVFFCITIRLPIPVDAQARSVSQRAKSTFSVFIYLCLTNTFSLKEHFRHTIHMWKCLRY